ncbi:caspase recruitment domain-containing protein 6 isoform X2 [Pteronotus mesoamericanus]|uniref:caspase recruitment domain-containing protein 6 isoform X2 n=1 Tax=Pteronotus mesoamericanus TaxID=1884717 RepID=UPI0023EB7A14|nr:caspase recruitment domain-containing protein 6 isoform X2 [Pteronotus parnellii mesoamericanus]
MLKGFCNPLPGLEKKRTMATESAPSEIIERERKKLLKVLQQDLDSVLDSLTSRGLISEDEYEMLEDITDPLKKSRKLLILVQKKGEVSCQHFLKCLRSTFPESATTWGLRHEKEHLDLETSEKFMDKKTSYGETAWSSRACAKDHTPTLPLPHSGENIEYKVSEAIYLQDGHRYDQIDDSLYLGDEDYLESVTYSEDVERVEEEDPSDPEYLVYDGEGEPAYSETTEFSGEEQSYEESETGVSLEEEEEQSVEERKKVFKDVLSCLNMDRSRKLWPEAVRQFSLDRGCQWAPEAPGDLAWNFLMKVQALDVTARDAALPLCEERRGELPAGPEDADAECARAIHPLDALCAAVLCSDSTLQRQVLANMYRCQFALPLLLPDAENNKSILMLAAMRDIVEQQPARALGGPAGATEKFLTLLKVPVLAFVRLGDCSFSKSRILNALLSPGRPESRAVFLHRERAVPGPPRRISDGLVEIAWCFPDRGLWENAHLFQEPVALANLRGDLERFWMQFGFLMEISSAVFFFTDCLGEKEWDLLMFLGEAAIKKCYFVLSPQARESEEAQIFQRILKLKPSQLLFWEEEEGGEEGRNIKSLQAALQEVMSSSLQRVSVEDMGSLARELGIQIDQDFENAKGIQVAPSENLAGSTEDEGPQRHSQQESSSESPAERPAKEAGAGGEASPAPEHGHLTPGVRPPLQNSCLLPIIVGGHVNRVPLRAPWLMGSHSGSGQKSRWVRPPPFQNSWVHSQGKSFKAQYFQPQRFCSGERFMKFPRPPWGQHVYGLFGRPPRPFNPCVQPWPCRPQTMGACERPAAAVSRVPHLHAPGLRPAGPFGKPQPRQAHPRGPQPTEATGKPTRTTSHPVNPHLQACGPAGVIQRPVRPALQQGFKLKAQGRPLDPTGRMGFHPMSNNKFSPSSPISQAKPPQHQHPQPKPSQPTSSQPKPAQTKPTQHQPSQPTSSPTKPTQHQPSQPKSSPSKPTQHQPRQPQSSPSKPTQHQPRQPQSSQSRPQPRPTQPKTSQTSHPQARASYARAGPKRSGKH